MEPQSPQASPSPEMGTYNAPNAPRIGGESVVSAPEKAPVSPETKELSPQAPASAPPVAPVAQPQLPTLPAPTGQPVVHDQPQAAALPSLASDDDVIEKEWVDKAKKIVNDTKDDPYTQEKEVSKLQADYIKKRYGKEIKLSSE